MRFTTFIAFVVASGASASALAQSPHSFQLERGQAIRITPDGKVDIFSKMQGDAAHIAEMEKRAHPITKGLAIWIGKDGKPHYLIDPVEGAEHFGRH
jgi:hypothetical protein